MFVLIYMVLNTTFSLADLLLTVVTLPVIKFKNVYRHPMQWVPRAFSPGVKHPGREADHSPPTNDEVKETWIYKSTPPYAFMA
jgi:hypothetical protein